MRGVDFRERALREAERYGRDPWVFVRELAQNARDAGARVIEVTTGSDDRREWVSFDDDGSGMSFAHARAFLFRLYASSKEDDPDAAGCFGVGFWSVLRFAPELIEVESRFREEVWAVRLDAALTTVQTVPCRKANAGTRVSLVRRKTAAPAALAAEVEGATRRYCRFLRRTGSGFTPLVVRVNGTPVNEEFAVEGPVSLSFKSREAEGVVGLGDEPRVELYARGLLVMTAAVLEELEPGGTVPAPSRRLGGLAPVVIINSNRLDVVLSRSRPVQSRALKRLVRLARARIKRLVLHLSEAARPETFWERLTFWLGEQLALRRLLPRLVVVGFGVALVGTLAWVATRPPPVPVAVLVSPPTTTESGPSSTPLTLGLARAAPLKSATFLPYSKLPDYEGATVEVPDAAVAPWGLSYVGPRDLLFAALTLDRYDPRHGWLRGDPGSSTNYPSYRCERQCVRVKLTVVAPDEPLVVPMPTGHRLDRRSLRFNGVALADVLTNAFEEALVLLPPGEPGVLEYTTGRAPPGPRPEPGRPAVTLPPALAAEVAASLKLPVRERAERLTRYVRDRVSYDISSDTARAYAQEEADWLARVVALNAGDCDVKNGLNVLLLRHAGIPARMAVGIAAHDGRARPQLHAWTEYYQNGWRPLDATGTVSRPTGEPARGTGATPTVGAPASRLPRRDSSAVSAPAFPHATATGAPFMRQAPASAVSATSGRVGAASVASPAADPVLPARAPFLLLLGLGLAALTGWAWRFGRARVRERWVAKGGQTEAQRALARMLKDALLHPEVWRTVVGVWQRRVLPTLHGRALSLADAVGRAVQGQLYLSRRHSELARLVSRRGTPVLDASDPVFGEVVSALGQGVDLDGLDHLRPEPADGNDVGALRVDAALEPANRLLRGVADGIECRACRALTDAAVRDVDLGDVALPAHAAWPRRFVAVNPESREVRERLALLAADPARGAFVWLDWLIDRSPLLAAHAARLRERAALLSLEVDR